jgi:hypothetical protein
MHTDQTLKILDDVTVRMGAEFRAFADKTCASFDTRELDRETEARKRRVLKKMQGQSESQAGDSTRNSVAESSNMAGPRRKKFNLQRYTYHSLGDYTDTIRQFGTSDSFSTEPVSTLYIPFVVILHAADT